MTCYAPRHCRMKAFDVTLGDGTVLWSKVDSGRFPDLDVRRCSRGAHRLLVGLRGPSLSQTPARRGAGVGTDGCIAQGRCGARLLALRGLVRRTPLVICFLPDSCGAVTRPWWPKLRTSCEQVQMVRAHGPPLQGLVQASYRWWEP